MRRQHYRFAHQVLRDAWFGDPTGLWATLASERSDALLPLWDEGGAGVGPADLAPCELTLSRLPLEGGGEALLLRLAPPVAAGECFQVALVRGPAGPRYFVLERGEDPDRPLFAEWRVQGSMIVRIRGQDLPSASAGAFLERIERELESSALAGAAVPSPRELASRPRRRRLVAGAIAAAVLGLGGWLLYQEELRGLHVPDRTVVEQPFVSGEPFALQFTWRGMNYAFNNLWLIVDEAAVAEQGGARLELRGTVRCGTSEKRLALELPGPALQRPRIDGPRFSGWVYLTDEYTRRSPRPLHCSGKLTVVGGTLKGRLAVTQRQRPADFLAF